MNKLILCFLVLLFFGCGDDIYIHRTKPEAPLERGPGGLHVTNGKVIEDTCRDPEPPEMYMYKTRIQEILFMNVHPLNENETKVDLNGLKYDRKSNNIIWMGSPFGWPDIKISEDGSFVKKYRSYLLESPMILTVKGRFFDDGFEMTLVTDTFKNLISMKKPCRFTNKFIGDMFLPYPKNKDLMPDKKTFSMNMPQGEGRE